jgi:branched-chain amino acid transport system ATP-binding protein
VGRATGSNGVVNLLDGAQIPAGYGDIDVLRSVSLTVGRGEVVAVLGLNGAGKSTLLRCISRYGATLHSGRITFDGSEITGATTRRTVQLGCVQVPEGRHLFTELSVEDN